MLFVKNLVCWTTISLDGRHVRVARAGRLLLSGCWTGWIVAVNFLQVSALRCSQQSGRSKTFPGRSGNMSWTLEHVLDCATCAKAQRRRNEFSSVSDPIWQYHTEVRHKPWPLRKGKKIEIVVAASDSIQTKTKVQLISNASIEVKYADSMQTVCRQHVDSMQTACNQDANHAHNMLSRHSNSLKSNKKNNKKYILIFFEMCSIMFHLTRAKWIPRHQVFAYRRRMALSLYSMTPGDSEKLIHYKAQGPKPKAFQSFSAASRLRRIRSSVLNSKKQ